MLAEVRVEASPAVVMLLPGTFRPSSEAGKGEVERRQLAAPLSAGAIRFEQWVLPEAGDVDITQQEILVAVGRGIQQKDNLELAEELARALGGAVCASRPVIDQGWLPPTRQVGKSGMTVKPKLYLALGISGAPEHQEGMKDADLIVAVNTDPNAPIFDIAHYGAQIDVLDLLPQMTEAIQAKKG
jgi:electron transfer flavoprotein alpha subunit